MADPKVSAPIVTPSINRFIRTNYAARTAGQVSGSSEIERSATRSCPTMARPRVYRRIDDAKLTPLDSPRRAETPIYEPKSAISFARRTEGKAFRIHENEFRRQGFVCDLHGAGDCGGWSGGKATAKCRGAVRL